MVSYQDLVRLAFEVARETHPQGLDAQYSNELMAEVGQTWRENPEIANFTEAQAKEALKTHISF